MQSGETKGNFMAERAIETTARDKSMLGAYGIPIPVRQGMYLVQVPLPHSPLMVLNSYVILGDNETTVIDVGYDNPACEEALTNALHALGRDWDSVQIILTHSHPDHTGNLNRVYREGMHVYANFHSFEEVQYLQDLEDNVSHPLLRKIASEEDLRLLNEERVALTAERLPIECHAHLQYLREGDKIECGEFSFTVIETPGHNPWHICLYDETEKLMIMGDHILERSTPAVSSWFTSYNALATYHASLKKIQKYDIDIVLAGHGTPYSNPAERADAIIKHDHERLKEIYELVAQGHADLIDISSHTKWRYANWDKWPIDQKFYSMGETMAHLVYLVEKGKVKQINCGGERRFELA